MTYLLHGHSLFNHLMTNRWDGCFPVNPRQIMPAMVVIHDREMDASMGLIMETVNGVVHVKLHADDSIEVQRVNLAKAVAWHVFGIQSARGLRDPFNDNTDIVRAAVNMLVPHNVFQHELRTFRMPTRDNWRFWRPDPTVKNLSKHFKVSPKVISYYIRFFVIGRW